MTTQNRWATTLAGIATAWALVACGGGGSSSTDSSPGPVAVTPQPSNPVGTVTPEAGAPVSVGNIAIDGRNWLNFRRAQAGIATLPENALIDHAAQAHSDYQKLNNEITHDEVAGKPGFTGTDLKARLNFAGYTIPASGYAYGEVISATSNSSGFFMAEELITAIYHRFVIFEPQFKEIGSGAATTSQNYSYFTADFGARNGYGAGLGVGKFVVWPFNGQTAVTPNFFSD
ncbi:MAG TPA: CAP domain-containing protein, partial [Telluria sp.]|nr:CAP domain-containing protein [Telluria sp.]